MMIHVTGPRESAKQAINRTIRHSNNILLDSAYKTISHIIPVTTQYLSGP
jgi:hypothetical protein